MSEAIHLSVNVDHIATLRQARGTTYPDPVDAAAIAEGAGATGITVHLRGDRRHIQEHDARRLRESVHGKLNMEISTQAEMLRLAREIRPDQVTLVPERPEEVTTEGGLDLVSSGSSARRAVEELVQAGLVVSIFIDPDPVQLDALAELGTDLVAGFELNTDAYTKATGEAAVSELARIASLATAGARQGFQVYAGHGLTTENVVGVAAVPEIEELNIGHWLVSRAALVGMAEAVAEMLAAMRRGRS